MVYKPSGFATRQGQRVDNPIIEHSDTARLRVLLLDETGPWRERIEKILGEIKNIQEVHGDRWREYFRGQAELASRESVRNVWIAVTAVGGVALTLVILLLSLLLGKK